MGLFPDRPFLLLAVSIQQATAEPSTAPEPKGNFWQLVLMIAQQQCACPILAEHKRSQKTPTRKVFVSYTAVAAR